MTKIFPTAMIVLSLLSAGFYAANQDWRKTVYWIAAATLTFVVTY